ncbi:hypothetical protein M408DRAFT_306253 [Serendipita vermifera MAFF 305830]|uniref:BRCT domain-containing protein n=1 Tax=Serendipita vermifera MAFF 305830 TaxID=933852 RepID=A0A0C3AXM2_SERVB|nr:hypothetical protein M408DRAFT_306253 [Serendipita vermifera MAFF 305830]
MQLGGGIPSDLQSAHFYVREDLSKLPTSNIPVVRAAWIKESYKLPKAAPLYSYLVESHQSHLSSLSLKARDAAEALKMLLEDSLIESGILCLHLRFPHNTIADWRGIYDDLRQWVQDMKDKRQEATDTAVLSVLQEFLSYSSIQNDQFTTIETPASPPDLSYHVPPNQSDITMEDIRDMKRFISLRLYGRKMQVSEYNALRTRLVEIMSRIGAN